MKRKMFGGFTLIELMIVLAIIAILAVIAFPSYQAYVLRSHRVEARNTLQSIAQRIEQNFRITRQWDVLSIDVGGSKILNSNTLTQWGLDGISINGTDRYSIDFAVEPDDKGYTLRATAIGPQINDSKCGKFFINQSGVRMATSRGDNRIPTSGRDAISRECWSR